MIRQGYSSDEAVCLGDFYILKFNFLLVHCFVNNIFSFVLVHWLGIATQPYLGSEMVSSTILVVELWPLLYAVCSGQPLHLRYEQHDTPLGTVTTTTTIDAELNPMADQIPLGVSPNRNGLNRQLPGGPVSHSFYPQSSPPSFVLTGTI